jgi:hypothetical protein
MTTAGREKSTSLAHAIGAVTTRRKGFRGDMARAFELRFWNDETNMKN